jgi:hypothetical protein
MLLLFAGYLVWVWIVTYHKSDAITFNGWALVAWEGQVELNYDLTQYFRVPIWVLAVPAAVLGTGLMLGAPRRVRRGLPVEPPSALTK